MWEVCGTPDVTLGSCAFIGGYNLQNDLVQVCKPTMLILTAVKTTHLTYFIPEYWEIKSSVKF
jgi:hypothetical protein